MARYTGPKHKLCRRLGECIWSNPSCPSVNRPTPPGQHGANQRRKKSVYGTQLLQKQKLKMHYGLMEKQLRRVFAKAKNQGGVTDANLMALLEQRLDCIIYRLGFANSVPAARQIVTHGHVEVNGKRVNIPSYHVSVGDAVAIREKSRKIPMVANGAESPHTFIPEYLDRPIDSFEGKLVATPLQETIPFKADTQAVIGFYSR
jgi:small subunit ribosomal protein S4